MKAAVLNAFGAPLAIETLPDPVLGTGEVIVDVVAAGVTSYAINVFSGARSYLLELPVVPGPGGIGRVRATGPDATRLKVGDWVYCDPTIRSRDDAANPDMILQGWTYRSEAASAVASFLSPRLLRRTDAGPDRERHTDRRDQRGGRGPVDSHRPAARAVRRAASGRTASRRDDCGERRHRRLRQRRRRRGARDGRGKSRRHRAQRAHAGRTRPPLRPAGAARQDDRRRG